MSISPGIIPLIKFAVATHSLEPEQVQIYFDNMKKSDVQDYKRILDNTLGPKA